MKRSLLERVERLERLMYEGNEDLHAMLFSGKPNQIAIAVNSGYDVDEPEFHYPGGMTALMAAAMDGNVRAVRALISAGANVNAKTREGKTPLDYAKYSDDPNVESILIKNGAM